MNVRQLALTGLLAAALASGCGFHLRGTVDIPAAMKNVKVSSTDPELGARLEELLRLSGASTGGGAGATAVRIASVRYDRNVSTVDPRGKVTGYTLVYTVSYSARGADGRALLDNETLVVQRDYEFRSSQMLAMESEEGFLRKDMERDAAQQIVRQLARALR